MMLVNGTPAQNIPADDRGLAYGDGVFRTLRTVDGRPLHWALQYAKLRDDCGRLAIACPAEALLQAEVSRASSEYANAAVKIIVTRGSGPRGYAPPGSPAPRRMVTSSPLTMPPIPDEGIRVHLCQLRLAHQPALAGVKHLNRLENVLARAEWQDPEVREGLLLDQDGNAIGGTMSSVFIVENGRLLTPDLSRCGVTGVTRDRVKAWADAEGVGCQIAHLPLQRLLDAGEVFFTNSLIGVWPAASLGRSRWPASVLGQRIRTALESEDVAAD